MATERPGVDAKAVVGAAADLEALRERFLAAGLGAPARVDGPLEVLILASQLELHALLREPPDSKTRGVTIRGLDRDFVVVPWHAFPGPRVTLAHEYAHLLENPGWPLWFREGRAVYLARRIEPRIGPVGMESLAVSLGRPDWLSWPELMDADRSSLAASSDLFQAQSWLLFHWLASGRDSVARARPAAGGEALSLHGPAGLSELLRAHLAALLDSSDSVPEPLAPARLSATVRPAAPWEIPLLEAEVLRELRFLDQAEPILSGLAEQVPGEARVQAAYASLLLMKGDYGPAEQRFRAALHAGDTRARTAYRCALLLMRPGPSPAARHREALRLAVRARDSGPGEPMHQLAVAQARMLGEDWAGAYEALRLLARFPGWSERVEREAREIRRRTTQSLRDVPVPSIPPSPPELAIAVPPPAEPEPWTQPSRPQLPARGRRIWPPYGTWMSHGRIAWVDCSGGDKKIVLHAPYRRIVLRVDPNEPPQLLNRPFREQTLPCESRGWLADVAYRKLPDHGSGVDGVVVGIRF